MDMYIEMLSGDAGPETEVMVQINESGTKWVLPYKDAYIVASLLNSASRIRGHYHKGTTLPIIGEPDDSVSVMPITGRHRILWDTNQRTIEDNKK
jgi:hypothetical protein